MSKEIMLVGGPSHIDGRILVVNDEADSVEIVEPQLLCFRKLTYKKYDNYYFVLEQEWGNAKNLVLEKRREEWSE